MGIDHNSNDVPDAQELTPSLQVAASPAGIRLSWPASGPGVVLEVTERLSPAGWRTETSPRTVESDRVTVAVAPAGAGGFYRLRRL